jgi:hypothetical protein
MEFQGKLNGQDYPEIKLKWKLFHLLVTAVPHEKGVVGSNICRQSNDLSVFLPSRLPTSCDFNNFGPIKRKLIGRRNAAVCRRFVVLTPTELLRERHPISCNSVDCKSQCLLLGCMTVQLNLSLSRWRGIPSKFHYF